MIGAGVSWLAQTQNADGGWGDTTDSPSNLSTTLLVTASLILAKMGEDEQTLLAARAYVEGRTGHTPAELIAALGRIYGADRTFATPILMNCALAGMVPWDVIPALPFELAIFPRKMYRALRLQVVSYALPALIAIGVTLHLRAPSRSHIRRLIRGAAIDSVLAKLQEIMPEDGGFLEAVPLTSFVAMSLGSIYGAQHPVVNKCLGFIRASQRTDGSWPIDSNLSVWLTTGTVAALASAGKIDEIDQVKTRQWIAERQYREVHPFTGAAPGGFSWTHLSGGVPDADDTSGAVLACIELGGPDPARMGAKWLLNLQNADGGWPAFCRGWGQLPFDRSSPDITAHALRALKAFDRDGNDRRCLRATARGYKYLAATQRTDGSWSPLWFGNQCAKDQCNPVFGTSRALLAYSGSRSGSNEARKAVQYLVATQNQDGGWGGAHGIVPSVEETALAVTALLRSESSIQSESAVSRGVQYLVARVEDRSWTETAPIGLYFSSLWYCLWYSERLYPVIWVTEALGACIAERCDLSAVALAQADA
jgi:squalene-hopene/tetraprenyl-beta-curcumene cyclase